MRINQITAVSFEGGSDIFGLGADNKVYYWSTTTGEWVLEISKPQTITESSITPPPMPNMPPSMPHSL